MNSKNNLFIVLLCLCFSSTSYGKTNQSLFQVSTIDALLNGLYDGIITLADLKQHGDFGIGTYDKLNGEMLLIDGIFYRIESTGKISKPDMKESSPFAAVTFFTPDTSFSLYNQSMVQSTAAISTLLPSENIFYAIKLSGTFSFVKTRSVPQQSKPYIPLTTIVKTQPEFEFKKVKGTITGFKCPSYVKGINVPGYHLHFIDSELNGGGHVLDFTADSITVSVDKINNFAMHLPSTDAFYKTNLSGDKSAELKKVEQK
jgi:acetolactate decarboxylase